MTIKIPKQFSFIDNPEGTLNVLSSLGNSIDLAKNKKFNVLYIDHSECELMDMGASLVLDVLVLAMKKYWRRQGKEIVISGKYPVDPDVRYHLIGTGLVEHLQIHGATMPEQERRRFDYFRLRIGRKKDGSAGRSTEQELATDDLVRYVNHCLQKYKVKLKVDGERKLIQLVGEVIDNAEQHSEDREWYVIGYMVQVLDKPGVRAEDFPIGECRICIMNFGRTINESLVNSETPQELQTQIDQLANIHAKNGVLNNQWREKDLYTLYALQEFINRENSPIRGTGTVKLIDFFQKLGGSKDPQKTPQMCIISGDTIVSFDSKYSLKSGLIGDRRGQVIAFNESNSLEEPPDLSRVHALDGFFPGTLISLRFFFDRDYLIDTAENVEPL